MIGWVIRGAIDLTWTIEYVVQAGRALIISFIWLLSLTGLGAAEYGVDRHVIGIVTVASTLVSVCRGGCTADAVGWLKCEGGSMALVGSRGEVSMSERGTQDIPRFGAL